MKKDWSIGLMTGTVNDGNIDIAALRTDGEEIHGHFYANDYIYGGLAISYHNLWPSNKSIVPADNILC